MAMEEIKPAALLTKAQRSKALPLRFKLGCWCGVAPLFLAGVLCFGLPSGWRFLAVVLQVLAVAAYAWLEIRSVEWLKRHGLY